MFRNNHLKLSLLGLLSVAPFIAQADPVFNDNFTGASTLDASPTSYKSPTATAYQTYVGLAGGSTNITANAMTLTYPSTTSVLGEFVGLFTNTLYSLNSSNDYVTVAVTFVNNSNILSGLDTGNSTLNIGLYNGSSAVPNQGGIVLSAGTASGGDQNWVGYSSRIIFSGSSQIFTRPAQTANGTTSQNQDLLFNGASGSQAYSGGTSLGSTASTISLTQGATYTLVMTITLTNINALLITNTLYAGAGTGGTVVFNQVQPAAGANFLSSGFNAMAIGWRNASSAGQASSMIVQSVTVTGHSSPPSGPPSITSQPAPMVVATGGAGAFTVGSLGAISYQWHRNGTNLLDGGNISGSTTPQLIIASASSADAFSGANGYYVTLTGPGNFTTNSVTNSLSLDVSQNLVWSGAGTVWDLATSASWIDGGNPSAVFNYGDSVTFDDNGAGNPNVTLTGSFLSASKWLITGSTTYGFAGTGSFAGPGQLIFNSAASGNLQMNVANTHTGGTIISNSNPALNVYLQQYQVLGNGPLVLATPGMMEVTVAGSASIGVQGDTTVKDDFSIQFDGTGAFAGVFLGNLSIAAGKTLTLTPSGAAMSFTNRYRVYGTNTVVAGNIVLDGNSTPEANYNGTVLAPYAGTGSQTYNGVISGTGGIVQRGSSTTYLNGANTYSGGTVPTGGAIGLGSDDNGSVGSLGSGALLVAPELPNSTGSGVVFASGVAAGGTRTIANPIQFPMGTNNQTLIIGGTNNLTFSGNIALQGQDGSSTVGINSRIFSVTNMANTIFSGNISDAAPGYGITKTGPGNLYLNGGSMTYTGVTTNNSAAGGTNGIGLLAGTGSIPGDVVVQTNSAIGGGSASGMGTLSIGGSLTLSGNGYFRVNRSGSASDHVSVATGITNVGTGTITITNLGLALQTGDTFTLFSKGITNGAALHVTGAGVAWVNNLAVNGTVQVQGALPPLFLTNSVSGSTLTLSWNPGYLGYTLQRQTNTLAKGLSTNWVDVPNTANVTATNMTIVPTNPAVFYRLRP